MKNITEKKLMEWNDITDKYGEKLLSGTEVAFTQKIIQSHIISKGIVIDKTEKKIKIIECLSPQITKDKKLKKFTNIFTKKVFLKTKDKIIKIKDYKFYIESNIDTASNQKISVIFPFNTKKECYNILKNISNISNIKCFISTHNIELNKIKNDIIEKFPLLLI